MKSLLTALAVVVAVLTASTGMAKSLEDVLKEKGVITEADYKEITQHDFLKYTYGQGFTLSSRDEKYSLITTFLLQLRYTLTDLDDVNNTPTKQAVDSSKFELRRIKLCFNGNAYSKDLTYRMVVNFANSGNSPTAGQGLLEETYMNYRYLDGLQVRFGQDKVQFGRQFITQSSVLQFIDTSAATVAFVPGIDTGLDVHGRFGDGLFNYTVAVLGGVGQNTVRTTTPNAFNGRITFNPLGDVRYVEADLADTQHPLVSFGADYFRDTLNGAETNNLSFATSKGWYGIGKALPSAAGRISATEAVDFNTGSADAVFKWRGFYAQGEYFVGHARGATTKNTVRAEGFYVQAGYFVIPATLEVGARYSYIDPNKAVTNDKWIETTAAVNWYISGHLLKLQTDYTNIHKQTAIASTVGKYATDDQQVRVQAQLAF